MLIQTLMYTYYINKRGLDQESHLKESGQQKVKHDWEHFVLKYHWPL